MSDGSLTRRNLLRMAAAAGGVGYGGLAIADDTDDGGSEKPSDSRYDRWQSICDTHWDISKRDPWKGAGTRSRVLKTVSSLEYLGASWSENVNPDPDSDADGAWKHTFVLSSTAVRMNELGSKPIGSGLQENTKITNNFEVASGSKKLEKLLVDDKNPRASTKDELNYFEDEETDFVRSEDEDSIGTVNGYSLDGQNLALSPYRDNNLFSFADPSSLIKNFNRTKESDIDSIFKQPVKKKIDRNFGIDVAAAAATEERKNVNEGGASLILGGISLVAAPFTGGASAVTGGLSLWAGFESLTEVPDDRLFPEKVPYNSGFGSRRAGSTAPLEAHYVMFDAVVAPGKKEAFYVNPEHKVKSDTSTDVSVALENTAAQLTAQVEDFTGYFRGPKIPFIEEFGDDFGVYRGYNKATATPTWLVGVEGPEAPPPAGETSDANARILGANFSRWENDESNGRFWRQSPRAGITGPGMLSGKNFNAALSAILRTDDDFNAPRIIDDLDRTPPSASSAEELTYDASDTALASSHIVNHDWRFKKIEPEYLSAARLSEIGKTVPIAYIFQQLEVTDPLDDPSQKRNRLKRLLNRLDEEDFADGPSTSELAEGLRDVVKSDVIDFDITKNTAEDPTVTPDLTPGFWGVTLIVEDEHGRESVTTELINIERNPPNVGTIEHRSPPLEVGSGAERFGLTNKTSTKDGVPDTSLEVSWRVSPTAELSQRLRRATGSGSIADPFEYVDRDDELKIDFKSSGEYIIKAIVSNPDNGVSTLTTSTVDVGQTLIADIVTPDEDASFGTGESGQFEAVLEEGIPPEFLTFTWTFRGPLNNPTQGPNERTPKEDKPGKNTLERSFATEGTYVVEVQAETPSGTSALITEKFTVGSGPTPGVIEDDFDYPTGQLSENGWTTLRGEFATENSKLVRTDGRRIDYPEPPATIVHEHPESVGSLTLSARNDSSLYPLVVRLATSTIAGNLNEVVTGYDIWIEQLGGLGRKGAIRFYRVEENGRRERLITGFEDRSESHDGEEISITIERDPDTYEFELSLNGNTVGTVQDDTYTSFEQVALEFDGDSRTQSVDRIRIGPTGPPAIDGNEPPTDPDADGQYEDGDGDGDFDSIDVSVLNDNLDSDAVQNNPEAFDFDGDGDVDVEDVSTLFSELTEDS